VVNLVTSSDGCYHDRETASRYGRLGGKYDDDEGDDDFDEEDDPWLKVDTPF
jgi:hypothetical protein